MSTDVLRDVPIPAGGSLLAELLRRLGLVESKPRRAVVRERDAFAEQAYEVTRAAWDSPNVQSLRQCFGEIGLSHAFAALELSLIAEAPRVPAAFKMHGPLHAPPHVVARLGKPTADLLTEALELTLAVLRTASEVTTIAIVPPQPPEALAGLRHALALGDIVAPSVAQVVLANLRGQAAFVFLLGAIGATDRLTDWRGVAAGEMALEGMKAFQRLVLPSPDHIDLDAAIREYAAFKARAFENLREAPPDDE